MTSTVEALAWQDEALCAAMPIDSERDPWFPEEGGYPSREATQKAATICGRCPVRQPCAVYAARLRPEFGIWAGVRHEPKRNAEERVENERIQGRAGSGVGRAIAVEVGAVTYVQPEEGKSATVVALELGITYRQLDYWCSHGWLGDHLRGIGFGGQRRFTDEDVENGRTLVLASKVLALNIQQLAARMRATRDLFAVAEAS